MSSNESSRELRPHYYRALSLLFHIENVLRVFVYGVLKAEYAGEWDKQSFSCDDEAAISKVTKKRDEQPTVGVSTICGVAKTREEQRRARGYIGQKARCPLMCLTFGELTQVIMNKEPWELFSPHFPASQSRVEEKLKEIESVRNALTHFRGISEQDVQRVQRMTVLARAKIAALQPASPKSGSGDARMAVPQSVSSPDAEWMPACFPSAAACSTSASA